MRSLRPADLIVKKRNKVELSKDDIEAFVQMVVDGNITDAQIGAYCANHNPISR